jgi:RNA polymerase sigma-54 factor
MRQLLTPRMIQSMEILQLPLLALEERIEQELQVNPVLEVREGDPDAPTEPEGENIAAESAADQQTLVVKDNQTQADDFARLERVAEYFDSDDFASRGDYRPKGSYEDADGRDRKMDAMANTPAQSITLAEHLLNQWAMIECPADIHQAGEVLINYITDDGYLRTPLETIATESRKALPALKDALSLIQTLEPAGVGAADLQQCLLLQLDQIENGDDPDLAQGHDFDLERALLRDHLKDLEMNRYPQMSHKLGRSIDQIKAAVKQLARLTPRPGRLIGPDQAHAITPDATIFLNSETGKYEISMARDPSENLTLSMLYLKMLKERLADKKTREFLNNNVRNAKWLIESIAQRKSTIQRVIQAVVDAQQEFFEQGFESLKPLPMILVAEQLGIHVATVSRAVSEKWIQTPRGIFPLRRFFSGGTTSHEGEDMSWDAVKEKLKIIIDNEDKTKPLNDDEIVAQLRNQGIDLARRTVAKYRKLLNIPTARQRHAY